MITAEEARRPSRLIAGALLLLVGGLFLLQNAGIVHAGRVTDYWPLVLVWVGLSRTLAPRRRHHLASGLVVLAMGIALQLDRLGVFWLNMRDFWPFLLILAGGALVGESLFVRRSAPAPAGLPERRS